MNSAIELRIDARNRPLGAGMVRRLLPFHARRMIGPFIFADLIGPDDVPAGAGLDIDAHPHIGMSTLTYLFDGRIVHRDSTGAIQTIEPRAVNWMTAGSGVTHTERAHPDDVAVARTMYGLQTWVALPDGAEETEPSFQTASAASIPVEASGRSTINLAAGSGWGIASPVTGSSPLVLAEVHVEAGSPVPIETGHPEVGVISINGDLRINDEQIPAGQLAVLGTDRAAVLGGSGTAMVLGGEPLGKRHIWWNFVHSDPDRIEQAKSDWAQQQFQKVPGDHEPFVPLPNG